MIILLWKSRIPLMPSGKFQMWVTGTQFQWLTFAMTNTIFTSVCKPQSTTLCDICSCYNILQQLRRPKLNFLILELFVHYLQNQNNPKIWRFPVVQSIIEESSTVCFCKVSWGGGSFSASQQHGLYKAEKGAIRPLVPCVSGAKAIVCPEVSTLHR